jgi:diguanylate cyclase (GGDEF)-like protein
LFIGQHVTAHQGVFFSFYFFGEYIFGLMFFAGCRNLVAGEHLTKRHAYVLLPAFLLALVLPRLSRDLNELFMIHSTTIAMLFGACFFTLRSGRLAKEATPGYRVMFAALLFLTVDFLHYVPVFGARSGLLGITLPVSYLQYTSIFDLVFEILLGFGTVMVLMEGVKREVERANRELMHARDQLALLAQMDPLTEALNRHAFHSLLSSTESDEAARTSGCVAVIDIDSLKPINDTFGHPAGDKVIRSVARAIRTLIRADDMLFRWGGDEFLVLMFKLPEGEAARRMSALNDVLEKNCEQWIGMPITVTVSYGLDGFDSLTGLGQAIECADGAMYAQRQQTRRQKPVIHQVGEGLGEAVL